MSGSSGEESEEELLQHLRLVPVSGSSSGEESEEESEEELLQHPSDLHPLVRDVPTEVLGYLLPCGLCGFYIDDGCYSCTHCLFTAHKACAKAPLLIPCHPFHPLHPLSLSHNCLSLTCDACGQTFDRCSSYGCSDCGFVLDIRCALFTLPNSDGSSPHGLDGDERQITIPDHNHPLTPFITYKYFHRPDGCNWFCCLAPLSEDVYMDRPWVFDIECILPELRKVNVKKVRDSVMKKSAEEVARKEEEVARMEEELFVLEKKVEETKRELEVLRKKHAELSLLKAQEEK
ncbi:hypothetical protein MLD38_036423 [Melastoma candidum]|uniref:Uncharacterized protein n=1 Tax=Melastoma candidum TaxID=119954 RepID=A0ACB9LJI9_9MYRT|nr:hypothetical protein MLD38_036423 [Melastoma candidum]